MTNLYTFDQWYSEMHYCVMRRKEKEHANYRS